MRVEEESPPVARVDPNIVVLHGDTRVDPYHWMKDPERTSQEVLAYLEAENAYADSVMKHTEEFQGALYEELKGRIQETDLSAPYRKGDYFYYHRTEEGLQYPIYCRKGGSLEGEEEVLLDQNALAEGHEYFALGAFAVSEDHRLLAYSTDTTGNELYTVFVKDLESGELLPDRLEGVHYTVVWASDNQTVLYSTTDEAQRPYRLHRHELGTEQSADALVYEEPDKAFYLHAHKSRSEDFIFLTLGSLVTSEVRYLRAGDPTGEFKVIHPRQHEMEYHVAHQGDRFLIWCNDEAKNFKLMEAPVDDPSKRNWTELIPHRPDVKIEYVAEFKEHLAILEREKGLMKVRIQALGKGEEYYVDFPEPVYLVHAGTNPEYDSNVLRFNYTSLVTPMSIYDYDMATRERELMKQQPVLGGYEPSRYLSERIFARSADGVEVPISIVYRKDFTKDGSHPIFLTGYGSYGSSNDPNFHSHRLTLLDRGFAFAIAHIRGGGDLGEQWRDDGKLLKKKNTFADFIACAEHLVAERYTSPDRLVISGGSAGGLLMGAVLNMRPDLFAAAIAWVPFVDVINSILDPKLLFSVLEYEEWGNPNDKESYDYIRTYCPYDNVEPKDYPHLLVRTSLHDPRVNYWEPAKWVAKLRTMKTDDHLLLLRTKMKGSHGGASGRYDRLRDDAFDYAFLLDLLDRRAPTPYP